MPPFLPLGIPQKHWQRLCGAHQRTPALWTVPPSPHTNTTPASAFAIRGWLLFCLFCRPAVQGVQGHPGGAGLSSGPGSLWSSALNVGVLLAKLSSRRSFVFTELSFVLSGFRYLGGCFKDEKRDQPLPQGRDVRLCWLRCSLSTTGRAFKGVLDRWGHQWCWGSDQGWLRARRSSFLPVRSGK